MSFFLCTLFIDPNNTRMRENQAREPADQSVAQPIVNYTIEATKLTRSYSDRNAVENLSLSVRRGEVVGLLGVNGAGKSTTMNMLAGILSPDQGDIRISGHSLSDQPLQARACLGYLPEQPPVYPELSVDAYLLYCARLRRVAKDKISSALEKSKQRCGLDTYGKRLIRNLSKGYQQRVGIAQAIIHQPDIIILDEPTVGLDPVQIIEIRKLIRELGDQHSVILSTHILPEVQSVCDRVLILREGQIVHDAPLASFPEDESLEQMFIRLTCSEVVA